MKKADMDIEERISAIEVRNAKVSKDKAWETSATRRAFIAFITYCCACVIFIYVVPAPDWALAAIVPTAGYLLSTLGLPWVRKAWERLVR